MTPPERLNNPAAGIAFIFFAMAAISLNDMLIKLLSGGYPLHQMIFIRSAIGICFSIAILQFEGGWSMLRTRQPGLHVTRALLLVVANMSFFAALASLPLADTTAIAYVAPLVITLLSWPMLGERVGPLRMGAVIVGFVGVIIVIQPWQTSGGRDAPFIVYLLPVVAAVAYALNSLLTRLLGVTSKPSAMAFYIQATFLLVSIAFWIFAGDGRYAEGLEDESLIFLLRAWVWPEEADIWLFAVLGLTSGIVGYTIAAAYRLADASTIATYEYVGLPMAIFWGWLIFGELPGFGPAAGIVLILGSGIFVFIREGQKKRRIASAKPIQRRY